MASVVLPASSVLTMPATACFALPAASDARGRPRPTEAPPTHLERPKTRTRATAPLVGAFCRMPSTISPAPASATVSVTEVECFTAR